eukprot:scaffold8205_cov239-Pinguiococcus_pyrenoidosus.AAC.2
MLRKGGSFALAPCRLPAETSSELCSAPKSASSPPCASRLIGTAASSVSSPRRRAASPGPGMAWPLAAAPDRKLAAGLDLSTASVTLPLACPAVPSASVGDDLCCSAEGSRKLANSSSSAVRDGRRKLFLLLA